MSSPTNVVPNVVAAAPRAAAAAAPAPVPLSTPDLMAAMLRGTRKSSDLFFSPVKPPLVDISGKLAPAGATRVLTNDDTRRIGSDLIGSNQEAIDNLKQLGSCDVSYSLSGGDRVFVQFFFVVACCALFV